MCNWTPWITQNVLICALTRDKDYFSKEKRRVFLEKAAVSCDFFLDEYGDDGCCNEGAQYYTHAGLCLFGCLELIGFSADANADSGWKTNDRTLGKTSCDNDDASGFSGIFNEKKIRNIANYIVKMYVGGGYYINFADCSALPGRRTAREFLFGKATSDGVLSSFAAADFRNEDKKEQLIEDEINLFYHVLQAFSYDEMMKFPVSNKLPSDSYFESTGLMVARDERYTLAVKAGNNADSHNHNDVGSFTIYKDGKPFVIDLGVGTYTQKTFSDKRYEIWTMQSQFHNLPTFVENGTFEDAALLNEYDGNTHDSYLDCLFGHEPAKDLYDEKIVMQKDGEIYAAKDVACNLKDDVCSISMDIAPAYGDERVKRYRRKAELIKGDGIKIEDEFDSDIPAFLSLMTYEKPSINSNAKGTISEYSGANAFYISVGNLGTIRLSGIKSVKVESWPITDDRLSTAWKHEVYRVVAKADDSKKIVFETL